MSIKTETERQKVIHDFLQWLDRHRTDLPVNSATWNFQFVEKQPVPEDRLISLGKYGAQKAQTIPFYKTYSKIYKF